MKAIKYATDGDNLNRLTCYETANYRKWTQIRTHAVFTHNTTGNICVNLR
jgi:hypothetical protein